MARKTSRKIFEELRQQIISEYHEENTQRSVTGKRLKQEQQRKDK